MDIFSHNYQYVKRAIENGADVNVLNDEGITPLLFATRNNNSSITQLLIQHGADVNFIFKPEPDLVTDICSFKGESALSNAIINKNCNIVVSLVENGADANFNFACAIQTIGHYIATNAKNVPKAMIDLFGDKEKLDVTIEEARWGLEFTKMYKGDIDKKSGVCGETLLHIAVEISDIEWVKYLLSRDANQYARDAFGRVPINIGNLRNLEIYRLLRDSINVPDDDNEIAIDKMKNMNGMKFLISIGSDYKYEKIKDKIAITRSYNVFLKLKYHYLLIIS
jgi:ankyrin repeat protein